MPTHTLCLRHVFLRCVYAPSPGAIELPYADASVYARCRCYATLPFRLMLLPRCRRYSSRLIFRCLIRATLITAASLSPPGTRADITCISMVDNTIMAASCRHGNRRHFTQHMRSAAYMRARFREHCCFFAFDAYERRYERYAADVE